MQQLDLFVPDRFDILQRRAASQLNNIVIPVEPSIDHIDSIYKDMRASGRGCFLIFRGQSGSGKSTFLHTLNLFREGVASYSIGATEDIFECLKEVKPSVEKMRIIILEGKEALKDTSKQDVEKIIHSINAFIRSRAGESTLLVWPCNTDEMQELLITVATAVGGSSLLDYDEPVHMFTGPSKENFIHIAEKTVSTLNDGASLYDLGISNDQALSMVEKEATIGDYLKAVRKKLSTNQAHVEKLLAKEQCRMWVVVVAGNDPDNDVAALTRGALSHADIDKMLTATEANVVAELKRYPEKLGILSAVLDAKIVHIPMSTILAAMRQYGNDDLKKIMASKGLSTSKDNEAEEKLKECDLAKAFKGEKTGTRTRGKAGSNTKDAFGKLTQIARDNDTILNNALGTALKEVGLIDRFSTEVDLGKGLTRRTDLVCYKDDKIIRVEMMWRAKTGRADIANYSLSKLYNYGRAIGFLD